MWYLCLYTHSPPATLVPRILQAQDYVSSSQTSGMNKLCRASTFARCDKFLLTRTEKVTKKQKWSLQIFISVFSTIAKYMGEIISKTFITWFNDVLLLMLSSMYFAVVLNTPMIFSKLQMMHVSLLIHLKGQHPKEQEQFA